MTHLSVFIFIIDNNKNKDYEKFWLFSKVRYQIFDIIEQTKYVLIAKVPKMCTVVP